ncbi:hypothetical protein CPB83DRAFT_398456 [Crepidotus variabilis]|uniref:Uncharacterized protein n=1 Tax=Crepidotus variabilis TaxID=179855 RepID=A0A9P6EED2_9AGAR|nr:hypothetical protein CPB83DRAFT_398456 [Crepidotus variabilis]
MPATARLLKDLKKVVLLVVLILVALYGAKWKRGSPVSSTLTPSEDFSRSCTPQAYAAGQWQRGALFEAFSTSNMTQPHDALVFAGFSGCASPCDFCNLRQLAADNEKQYDRFPRAHLYEWAPGDACTGLKPLDIERFVKTLVEDGGWFLVGDSVSENHFFSLSCLLYGHVIATPDFTESEHWERDYPQHLYLSASSPIISTIDFPKGFDINKTPLVSFKRIDVLFSKQELIEIHRAIQPPGVDMSENTLFGEEAVWTTAADEYLTQFTAPLPGANYATMVVSTGAHWTVGTFGQTIPEGIDGVLNLFEHAMKIWLHKTETHIDMSSRTSRPFWSFGPFAKKVKSRRRAVVRAYPAGHENCHETRAPWTEIHPFSSTHWNWNYLQIFNEIFEKLLVDKIRYPNIHYLGIDRPARLRPDAHITGDCLHIMTGAGVLEGWTQYISHFITNEL